jgi:hypothetical protein
MSIQQMMMVSTAPSLEILLDAELYAVSGISVDVGLMIGYSYGTFGSLTPANTTYGYPVLSIGESMSLGAFIVSIYDFESDPGMSWLTYIEIDGLGIRYPTGYTYINTVATWALDTQFGLEPGGTYHVKLVRT